MTEHKNTFLISRWLICRCVAFIYLVAFCSLYVQIPGLYGVNGLLPVEGFLKRTKQSNLFQYGISQMWNSFMNGSMNPSLITLNFPYSVDENMHLLCLTSILFSFLALIGLGWAPVYVFLWLSYLSFLKVGQAFLSFQWDILLIETGFIVIFLSPLWCFVDRYSNDSNSKLQNPALFLIRWLNFRLMFASGIVKLSNNCPAWWGLTAMQYHHFTTCIPTPIAWYAHQSPEWFHRMTSFFTFFVELFLPIWSIVPLTRSLRLISGVVFILFQVGIELSGNYTFFNMLSAILALSLLDDAFFRRIYHLMTIKKHVKKGHRNVAPLEKFWTLFFDVFLCIVVIIISLYLSNRYFGVTVGGGDKQPPQPISVSINFSKQDWRRFVSWVTPKTVVLGALSFLIFLLPSLVNIFLLPKRNILRNLMFLFLIFVALGLFSTSSRRYENGLGINQNTIGLWSTWIDPITTQWHLTSSYGLFATMTLERPEVIIFGQKDEDSDWLEYEFKYKVGNITRAPPFVAPHQPRLDWQMWFAALGSYERNNWFIHLMIKLLQPNNTDIVQLLAKVPFPLDQPPKYIKADLYDYKYSRRGGGGEEKNSGKWWTRTFVKSYIPTIFEDLPTVKNYVQEHQWRWREVVVPSPSSSVSWHPTLAPLALSFVVAALCIFSSLVLISCYLHSKREENGLVKIKTE